jgi:hypothetical protein
MGMAMFMVVVMIVVVVMFVFEVNVEFHSFNGRLGRAPRMQVIPFNTQFLQFVFERVKIDAKVQQRADEHIAADARENIQI